MIPQWFYSVAAVVVAVSFGSLSYAAERQRRRPLAIILAVGACLFAAICALMLSRL